MTLQRAFTEALKMSRLYERMKNLFHLATSISPLLALSTRRFQTLSLKREHLIAVSYSSTSFFASIYWQHQAYLVFGNNRSSLLAATERELWKLLLRINAGSKAMAELSKFLQTFDGLEAQFAEEDPELDWFSSNRVYHLTYFLDAARFSHRYV
jgi:hypothetical protein